jgi:predicted dehydrogenase
MGSPAPVAIGYLGVAHGHGHVYAGEFARFPDARLTRVWDRDPARARAFAERFGLEVAPSPEEVLRASDAVVIAAETAYHAELCLEAIAAGRAVLCQKPLCLTVEECDRVVAAVDRAGVFFETAFQMRYDPANVRLCELVHGGAIGRVGWARRRHCIPVLFQPAFLEGPSRWHVDPALNRGMFFDDAVHAADFLRWLLGEPVSVVAEVGAVLSPHEDTGLCVYRFASGAMAELANSSTTWIGENTCEVYGDEGVIIQNHDDAVSTGPALPPHPVHLKIYRRAEADKGWQDLGIPLPGGHGERIARVARGFLDGLRRGRPTATARDGRAAVAMVDAAYRAAATGRRVEFQALPPRGMGA